MHKYNKNNKTLVQIGSGEHAIFIHVKKGNKVYLEGGTIIKVGITPKECERNLEDRLDDIAYTKPVALVKKLKRRFNK